MMDFLKMVISQIERLVSVLNSIEILPGVSYFALILSAFVVIFVISMFWRGSNQ